MDKNIHESELYQGYNSSDIDLLKMFSNCTSSIHKDHYIDGFGVKTNFDCIPFVQPQNLNLERLQLPVPDDGYHAETIEYISLLDSINRCKTDREFCAVELGAGWAPWITAGGVIARDEGLKNINLIGVEGHKGRFQLMQQHLENNSFEPKNWCIDYSLHKENAVVFNGVVWTHDGEILFPRSEIIDMGSSASSEENRTDYRGLDTNYESTPCLTLPSLCNGLDKVHYLHIDIQGAEYDILNNCVSWLNNCVNTLMVATHSRVIEGQIIDLLLGNGWSLYREKPCRVDWSKDMGDLVGWTVKDGSQYWINQ